MSSPEDVSNGVILSGSSDQIPSQESINNLLSTYPGVQRIVRVDDCYIVVYDSPANAARVKSSLDGISFNGQTINVSYANPPNIPTRSRSRSASQTPQIVQENETTPVTPRNSALKNSISPEQPNNEYSPRTIQQSPRRQTPVFKPRSSIVTDDSLTSPVLKINMQNNNKNVSRSSVSRQRINKSHYLNNSQSKKTIQKIPTKNYFPLFTISSILIELIILIWMRIERGTIKIDNYENDLKQYGIISLPLFNNASAV